MLSGRNILRWGATGVAPLCCLLWLFWPKTGVLLGSGAWRCAVADETFTLHWRHSVEKQDWQEVYRVQDGRLHLLYVYVQTFGAGVPASGQPVEAPPGYVGMTSDVVLRELHWVVSRRMRGDVVFAAARLPVHTLLPDDSVVHIVPVSYARWQWFLEKDCL